VDSIQARKSEELKEYCDFFTSWEDPAERNYLKIVVPH
jgi:hypothetical protein